MALNGLVVEIGAGPKGGLCVDSTVLGLMQRTVTLEEKVSQLFELLRDPVYLYLTAVLGSPAARRDFSRTQSERPCANDRDVDRIRRSTISARNIQGLCVA